MCVYRKIVSLSSMFSKLAFDRNTQKQSDLVLSQRHFPITTWKSKYLFRRNYDTAKTMYSHMNLPDLIIFRGPASERAPSPQARQMPT